MRFRRSPSSSPPSPPALARRPPRARQRLRVYTGLDRTDVAVLWINGFNRLPASRKGVELELDIPPVFVAITPEYRRQVFGLTLETFALDPFVLRGEGAFYTSYLFDQPSSCPNPWRTSARTTGSTRRSPTLSATR